jgi:hypothetical protein
MKENEREKLRNGPIIEVTNRQSCLVCNAIPWLGHESICLVLIAWDSSMYTGQMVAACSMHPIVLVFQHKKIRFVGTQGKFFVKCLGKL